MAKVKIKMVADSPLRARERAVIAAAKCWALVQQRQIEDGSYSPPFTGDAEDRLLKAVAKLAGGAR